VSQPDYAQAVAKAVHEVPVATWKLYFRARVMDANANLLAKPWRDAHFAFHGKALSGSEQPKPRWQQGIDALDGALGEAVGQQYVARYFPADHKARMQELVANLLKAYGESIDGLTWMSPATKVKAREKLSKYATKIGYPDKWRDYSGLVVKEGDPVGNAERAGRFEFKRVAAKLGQPVDRSEWLMSPQTVNAYYNPSMNEIVFPAAILEPPFFDMAADDAANYGAIGAIIGHEISHGFDDQGRSTTATASWTTGGRRKMPRPSPPWASSWWRSSPATSPAGPQGQRPADPGREHRRPVGLQIAYKAWKLSLNGATPPVINGLTGEQRFFYSFAHAWRSKYREELQLRLLTADPHSPPEFRANGTVINHDGFQAAFGVKPGDKMYKAPQDRIRIW
jgi:putative endopeptidase